MQEIAEDERSNFGITMAMRVALMFRATSFRRNFLKFMAVTNLKLNEKFLEEVVSALNL